MAASMPSAPRTATGRPWPVPGGTTQATSVCDRWSNLSQGVWPISTAPMEPGRPRFRPVMVTTVPPTVGPPEADTPVIAMASESPARARDGRCRGVPLPDLAPPFPRTGLLFGAGLLLDGGGRSLPPAVAASATVSVLSGLEIS